MSDGLRRREQAPKLCLQRRRPSFQVKDQDFQVENQPLKIEIELKNFRFARWQQRLEIVLKFFEI